MKALTRARAQRLLAAMEERRVLVVGDVMLDEFLWGRVARISPEAPVPVVGITAQTYHLGGAANVACNVRSLGGQAVVAGVVGRDAAGQRLREALVRSGVEDALALDDHGRPTTHKTRIIAHHQQVVRADREETSEIGTALEDALGDALRRSARGAGAIILSDYLKGVVTRRSMKDVLDAARREGVPLLVDPKVRHFALYRGAAVVTPNQMEAEQATGVRIRDAASLHEAGRRILKALRCRAALITRGEHGMALFEQEKKPVEIPTTAQQVFDVTGAGDTVIASLALALAAGATLPEAAMLANYAAGVVVGKIGTATVSPEEVLAAIPP
jgi:D-beta-D-heptose 7-phosphate kinase/D-beta-D-heptose 1-phosphate adenosyltransferase